MGRNKFSGEYFHSLDTKGRVIVPQCHREALGDVIYITKGLDPCLYIYSEEDWYAMIEKLDELPDLLDNNARALKRFIVGSCKPCEVDKQGRVLIPQSLREHAGLTKDAVLVGIGNRIEVWNKESWDTYNNALDIEAITANLKASGIRL